MTPRSNTAAIAAATLIVAAGAATGTTTYELGEAVFNTQWVLPGTPGAERHDGLGPLFNAAACDACHNGGSRGRGPDGDGPLPQDVVLQPGREKDATGADPHYGTVLSTNAAPGFVPEGGVAIHYAERTGHFADGTAWTLRVPRLRISDVTAGPLDRSTVLKPRLAPAIFGVGLLEAVPDEALVSWADPTDRNGDGISGRDPGAGRLGWQASTTSIREQTGRAFAREMGLTSTAMGAGDCSSGHHECGDGSAGRPEVSDELLDTVIVFQQMLAVPTSSTRQDAESAARGKFLFATIGCAACHRPQLPVRYWTPDGQTAERSIEPYTDLLLHDLGAGLADRTVAGRVVPTEWRTAPLWGHGAGVRPGPTVHLLHDGRARSVTEAILWHDGEAARPRDRFTRLGKADREMLSGWLENR